MVLCRYQRIVRIGALLCCLSFVDSLPTLAQMQERTVITRQFDTVLVRTNASLWHVGLEAGVGAGWNLGGVEMPASINNAAIQALFSNGRFAALQLWDAGVKSSYSVEPDRIRVEAGVGLRRQTALLQYEPSRNIASGNMTGNLLEYSLLQSSITLNALYTHAMVEMQHFLLPELSAMFGANVLWAMYAEAQTQYIRPNTVGTLTPPIPLTATVPIFGVRAGLAYNLRSHESSTADISLRGRFQPSFSVEWQPIISAGASYLSSVQTLGGLALRLGCTWNIEWIQPDTFSIRPFIRPVPIAPLVKTPLSSRLYDEEGAAGRIVAPQELKEAVLEDRVFIYRPDDTALIHGIPSEALDILRNSVTYIRAGARCQLILTIPTKKTSANVPQAESALRVMGDYLLKKSVEVSSIEAGLAENIYNAGEAWQLRIRIARAVR